MNDDQLIELEEYANLEGAELGEIVNLLLQLNNYQYRLSDEFKKVLVDELETNYRFFTTEALVVERGVVSKRIVKELVWENI